MGFEVGSILEGKVTGITKFGAFVSLPENRSGLVHISEIAYSYVNDVHDHLSEGQTVTVKVIGIDDNNRINLSIKQAAPPPARQERRPNDGPRFNGPQNGGERPAFSGSRRPQSPRPFQTEAVQPKGPASFEDQLKQFMASSDSKLSELHMNERRSSRRGGGNRRG
ncbi:MAG: S1 RNA-binding domain-containing protein [Oscillospiraceae bacterium]|nr:S1 RNA-binding domain-containing protein [Oscillospiraceae bacterium]